NSDAWDREGWVVFLGMICDHADFLVEHYSNHRSSSNWLTMEASALMQLGILFPEMENSSTWFETGYRRVMHELKYSFDNDGVHMERTPIYHLVASIAFLQAWEVCVKNNIPVPPYGFPTLEKSAEFIMKLVKPDFSTPMIGDADRNDLKARKSDTSPYEGMNLSFFPDDLNELRAYFRKMYDLTNREDFLYFATEGKEGTSPEQLNYAMKEQGIYVMRTGWEEDDSYFHVHGIQLERGERSTHSHNDQLHFELQIKGEDILIDSGRYIYNSSCWKDWRHYFLSAAAHNTVYIDDHEMGTVMDSFRIRGARTYCHNFKQTEDYSIIDLSHNGYVFTDDPIFHRRRVIRLDGDIYIIDDQLTGLGKQEHDIRLYFNFAPGELVNTSENNYQYTTSSGKEYNYFSLLNDEVTSVFLEGSEEPKGGWVSYGYAERSPIPQMYLSSKGPIPVRFVSVIAPKGIEIKGFGDTNKAEVDIKGYGKVILLDEDFKIEK
ncbi:MAG TPA: alginate lyase family protein, partial [Thermoclostridium sp.]|nr:alginate lyase family protein [Thermoclostridium sp.]